VTQVGAGGRILNTKYKFIIF